MRILRSAVLVGVLIWSFGVSVYALDIPPKPDGYVTDKAGLFSAEERSSLEKALAEYERNTTNQIVVAAFLSLEGESLEDFSIRLAEAWKVGQKGKDNGIILLIFKNDRKMRIEVGYGLEGALPDALAGQIIQNNISPYFKQGQFFTGIASGVRAIAFAIAGEYQASASQRGRQREIELTSADMKAFFRFIVFAMGILFLVDLARYRKYAKDHQNYNFHYHFGEWFLRFAILMIVITVTFRLFFYMLVASRMGSSGRGGGFSGGGDSFGGGGFSGGGGSFGGGGASGGW